MEMIPLALQIIGAIGNSGLAGTVIKSLAGLLGGSKAGEVAGTIVDTASRTFGTTDPSQIQLKIAQDKTTGEKFAAQLAADTERYRISVEDTQDARKRDVAIRGLSGGSNTRANVLLIGAFVLLVVVICGLFYFRGSIPDGIVAILNAACGSLLTLLGQAFNFEFGSSRGSAEKSDQMAAMLATGK